MKYDINWYESLIKPWFQPPSWVFSPVWSILYLLMFTSLFLIIREGHHENSKIAYLIFSIQLMLNFSWPLIFFKYNLLFLSSIVCVVLTVLVFIMILIFYKISKTSAFLLVPYFLWLIFASILNFQIFKLNS